MYKQNIDSAHLEDWGIVVISTFEYKVCPHVDLFLVIIKSWLYTNDGERLCSIDQTLLVSYDHKK